MPGGVCTGSLIQGGMRGLMPRWRMYATGRGSLSGGEVDEGVCQGVAGGCPGRARVGGYEGVCQVAYAPMESLDIRGVGV
jgi:hypothetical protein